MKNIKQIIVDALKQNEYFKNDYWEKDSAVHMCKTYCIYSDWDPQNDVEKETETATITWDTDNVYATFGDNVYEYLMEEDMEGNLDDLLCNLRFDFENAIEHALDPEECY